jgi:hypothetical protein
MHVKSRFDDQMADLKLATHAARAKCRATTDDLLAQDVRDEENPASTQHLHHRFTVRLSQVQGSWVNWILNRNHPYQPSP